MTSKSDSSGRSLCFGRFVLTTSPLGLTRDGTPLPLPEAPLQVLARLVERPGEVVTYDAFAQQGGGAPSHTDPTSLRASVRLLRQALRDPAGYPIFIETVRGYGYRFIAPVAHATSAEHHAVVYERAASPGPHLVRWLTDDDAAMDFTVVCLSTGAVASAVIADARAVLLLAILPALRIVLRVRALRTLLAAGVDATDVRHTLDWADRQVAPERPPRGWRAWLRRGRTAALAMSAVALGVLALAPTLRPWEASAATQHLWQIGFSRLTLLLALTATVVVVDAVATPHPVLPRARHAARHVWRSLVRRYVTRRADDQADGYLADARREVERILA